MPQDRTTWPIDIGTYSVLGAERCLDWHVQILRSDLDDTIAVDRCPQCGGPLGDATASPGAYRLRLDFGVPEGPRAPAPGQQVTLIISGHLARGEIIDAGHPREPGRCAAVVRVCSRQCFLFLRARALADIAIDVTPTIIDDEEPDDPEDARNWDAVVAGDRTLADYMSDLLAEDPIDRETEVALLAHWRECPWCLRSIGPNECIYALQARVIGSDTVIRQPVVTLVRVASSALFGWVYHPDADDDEDDEPPQIVLMLCSERCRQAVQRAVKTGVSAREH